MSIRHHPSHAMILDFAAGSAPRGRALVLAAHIARCPECRAELAAAEAVGGALLADLPPAPMSPGALDRALAAVALPDPTVAYASDDRTAPEPWLDGAAPEVIDAYRRNKRWFAPGVWVAHIGGRRARGEKSYLLGIGPDIAVPHHTHRGIETTVVLKGAFIDREHRFGPGDFAETDDDVRHRPHTTREGECVCLIATDAPLSPLDLVGRLFQPICGI